MSRETTNAATTNADTNADANADTNAANKTTECKALVEALAHGPQQYDTLFIWDAWQTVDECATGGVKLCARANEPANMVLIDVSDDQFYFKLWEIAEKGVGGEGGEYMDVMFRFEKV